MEVKNNSGWRPTGSAVLLRAIELQDKGGKDRRIVVPQAVAVSSSTCDTIGIVVALGADCWKKEGESPRAKVGDRVLFTQFSGGTIIGKDDFVYRMIPCHAIYAVREEEDENP